MLLWLTMEYYAIQVWTGKEDQFAAAIEERSDFDASVFVPRRALTIWRAQKKVRVVGPIFKGYAFIASDGPLTDNQRWILRETRFYLRTLPAGRPPEPVKEKDRKLLSHFMSYGKVADTSKVLFDENQRIVVLEGPLKGLEGLIVKVDRRKCRARIRLDMYEDSFPVDLAFEVIDRSVKGQGAEDGKLD